MMPLAATASSSPASAINTKAPKPTESLPLLARGKDEVVPPKSFCVMRSATVRNRQDPFSSLFMTMAGATTTLARASAINSCVMPCSWRLHDAVSTRRCNSFASSSDGCTKLGVFTVAVLPLQAQFVVISPTHHGLVSVSLVRYTNSNFTCVFTMSKSLSSSTRSSLSMKILLPVMAVKSIFKSRDCAAASALWWQMKMW
mmetsp:Transcript_55722/g.130395  ORF Transcript_55722/g.130395 Transcript_55722/m.130395 type:complete len:200 (-) Transcript_55722:62-661(-)